MNFVEGFVKAIYISIFLIIINLFCFLLLNFFSPTFKKVSEIQQFNGKDFDVVFFGNSAGLDGVDASYLTNEVGLKSYNFCLGGTHIKSSLILLNDYLQNNKKPKKIVLCLTSSMETTFLKKYPFVDPCINYFYNKSFFEKITTIYFKEFEWLFVEMLKLGFSKPHREAMMLDGQWKINKTIEDNSQYLGKALIEPNYNSNYLDYFEHLVAKENIELILIEMPGWRKHRNELPFEYKVNTRSEKVVKIHNFNNIVIADSIFSAKTDWLSLNHLNEKGANNFSKNLVRILKAGK